jgi:hypothetical protein
LVEEDINAEQPVEHWFINLDWFPQNSRSFPALAGRCLCSACYQRLMASPAEVAVSDLLGAISSCCSKKAGFIHDNLPIMESVFRLFLANKNRPLDLEELSRGLNERRGGAVYRTSPEALSRLLKSDRYYGLGQVEG